jgi:hypothetical protein
LNIKLCDGNLGKYGFATIILKDIKDKERIE